MKKPLILTSDCVKFKPQNRQQLTNNNNSFKPVKDYVKIAQELQGQLLGYDWLDARYYQLRKVEKAIKLDIVEAALAIRQLADHNVILSTSEKVAIPFAALAKLTHYDIPHVLIAHKLSSTAKSLLFRTWPLHQSFSRLVFLCRSQCDYAINELGIPRHKVDFVYNNVDHHFFYPQNVQEENYILAVGQEQRDYETLIQAITGTNLSLVVCASSPWSTHRLKTLSSSNQVRLVKNISYLELRELYAKAKLVVVPLFDSCYAAGVSTVLEAMAMGKPVIVTRSEGIIDYLAQDETGRLVSPTDVDEMRDTILSLWDRPKTLKRLGLNARQTVEECMNLDIYVERISQIIREATNVAVTE